MSNRVKYFAQNTQSEVRYGMNHFQTPNTLLSPKRLRELSVLMDDTSSSLDATRNVLRELYNTVQPGNDLIRQRLTQWYRMSEMPTREISVWIDTQLIPTTHTKCSDLAKKRRQTPRRRYTLKRKEFKSS